MRTRIIQLQVKDQTTLNFGDKVYTVQLKNESLPREMGGLRVFREKCPICEGKKKIQIKGHEFPCPACEGRLNRNVDTRGTELYLFCFDVVEYIVHKVEIAGRKVKSAYKQSIFDDDVNIPYARWSGFTSWGAGGAQNEEMQFSQLAFLEHNPEQVRLGFSTCGNIRYCFLRKPDAKKFCSRLHQRQKEMLEEFNKEHGTNYEYPFTAWI